MSNILVTGGAGYLGSVLVPELLWHGHSVTVLDNLMYRQTSLLDCCYDKNFLFVRGDCRRLDLLTDLIAKADIVIPLAAIVGAPACEKDKDLAIQTNITAILDLLHLIGDRIILYPTTNSGYGIGQPGVLCTEDTPLKPISVYGRTKVEAEKFILGSAINAATFRLATVFGASPRMRLDLLVNDLVHRAVADRSAAIFEGNASRNYVHIRDVASLFVFAIKNFSLFKGTATNVGLDSANLTKLQLCQKIQEHLPAFDYHASEIGADPDKRDYLVSNAKLLATGFEFHYSLDDGINELIKCFQIINANQFTNA